MKKRMWICSGIIVAAATFLLISMLFDYVVIDFSSISDKIGGSIGDAVGSFVGFFSGKKNSVTLSGFLLIKNLLSGSKDSLSGNAGSLLSSSAIFVLAPYICAVIAIICAFFRKVWSYCISLIGSAAGLTISLLGMLVIIPKHVSDLFPSFSVVDIVPEKTVREAMLSNTGLAWWVSVIASLVIAAFSIWGIVLAVKEGRGGSDLLPDDGGFGTYTRAAERNWKKGRPARSEGGIICDFGDFAGVTIPIAAGEELVLGSDSISSNLVIQEPWIDGTHCIIKWDSVNAVYTVSCYARDGISVNSRILSKGSRVTASSGDVIFISRHNETIRLV